MFYSDECDENIAAASSADWQSCGLIFDTFFFDVFARPVFVSQTFRFLDMCSAMAHARLSTQKKLPKTCVDSRMHVCLDVEML